MSSVEARPAGIPFRTVHVWATLLVPATLFAFWTTYFNRSDHLPELAPVTRLHAILMFGWLLMLVTQAWLVRTGRFRVHRWLGRSSFVIVPIIVWNGLATIREQLRHTAEGDFVAVAALDLVTFGILIAFATTWGLAMLYRRRPHLHVRFILSTAFAIGPAIVFRIFLFHVPAFGTDGAALAANFVVVISLLLGLIALDWRRGVRRSPYWVVTVMLASMHLGYWTIAGTETWLGFCRWFAGLP